MKVVGIITEYNPLHTGHQFHIQKSKELTGADYVIAVMSGNFVQRGEPAIFSKWVRTQAALACGVDMVIELPVLYATASAEFFALGAVKLLQDMNMIDFLCFGSESGDIAALKKTAALFCDESAQYKQELLCALKSGLSFPAARNAAAIALSSDADSMIKTPNNILGVEYLKALEKLHSPIQPITIARYGNAYHSNTMEGDYSSATAMRGALAKGEYQNVLHYTPSSAAPILEKALEDGAGPVFMDAFTPMLQYCLRTIPPSKLKTMLDVTEGLEHRFIHCLLTCSSYREIVHYAKTKRYTLTKIQRALLHILLQITKDTMLYHNQNGMCPYIRVLGFREKSIPLFKELSKKTSLPLLAGLKNATKRLDPCATALLSLETRATDIYCSILPNPALRAIKQDYTTPVIKQ